MTLEIVGRMFGRKAEPRNKGKDCGLQEPDRIFFFFGINLSYKLYAMTDNLSKSPQSTKMPTIKGKKCADLVIDTVGSMRNDEDFDSYFEVVKKASNPIKPVGKPTLPRKQKKPNYFILQYVTGYEEPESNAYLPEKAHGYMKPMYF